LVPSQSIVTVSLLLTCSLYHHELTPLLQWSNLVTRSGFRQSEQWYVSLHCIVVDHPDNDDLIGASIPVSGGDLCFCCLVKGWLWHIPAVPMLQNLWIWGIMSHYISEVMNSKLIRALDVLIGVYCNSPYSRWKPNLQRGHTTPSQIFYSSPHVTIPLALLILMTFAGKYCHIYGLRG
jgi:hypothetical protein